MINLQQQKQYMKTSGAIFILISILLYLTSAHQCQHHHLHRNTTRHFLNDLTDGRLLQGTQTGKLRIFVDYTQVTVGGPTEINTIKRIMNISASYFYNVLNVTRLPRLYFPKNVPLQCNALTIPSKYIDEGAIGDLGIVCGNQNNPGVVYIAKSTPCAFLESTKRPIWGMVVFNNVYLKYDQQGFQQILFIGLHQLTHVLGFSASMYKSYPGGNILIQSPDGQNYLNSPKIQQEIKNHFGCTSSPGLLLQDQDGTLVGSHWQKKVVGNQFMIASNKKGSFVSRFTLALLDSTGFYSSVNYTFGEPTNWGKGKGCSFLNVDDCNFDQFCNDKNFSCDADSTAIGRCGIDPYTGSCLVPRYFTNTICIDENYEIKNLNSKLNALQRGGSTSRCFNSDFRQEGLDANALNNRCYTSVCSVSGRFIYVLVGSFVIVCREQGQIVPAPPGLAGTLTCPRKFPNQCNNKKTCPYHCNKNGGCINGRCLCTGAAFLTQSCIDISILVAPIGSQGGFLNAKNSQTDVLLDPTIGESTNNSTKPLQVTSYSIDRKCIQGTAFDELFGQCLKCSQLYNCLNCDDNGCIICDNDSQQIKSNGSCA